MNSVIISKQQIPDNLEDLEIAFKILIVFICHSIQSFTSSPRLINESKAWLNVLSKDLFRLLFFAKAFKINTLNKRRDVSIMCIIMIEIEDDFDSDSYYRYLWKK